jgi:uncharacterized protein YidB (DUF937 family)
MALGRLALALMGLLAYQNRDKIGDFLRGQTLAGQSGAPQSGGILDTLVRGGGLREVLDRFRSAGAGDQVDSWVGRGDNQPLQPEHVERAIDPATLDEISRQTGLSKEELVERITKDLPRSVDTLTPTGQLPQDIGERQSNLLDDVPPALPRS